MRFKCSAEKWTADAWSGACSHCCYLGTPARNVQMQNLGLGSVQRHMSEAWMGGWWPQLRMHNSVCEGHRTFWRYVMGSMHCLSLLENSQNCFCVIPIQNGGEVCGASVKRKSSFTLKIKIMRLTQFGFSFLLTVLGQWCHSHFLTGCCKGVKKIPSFHRRASIILTAKP